MSAPTQTKAPANFCALAMREKLDLKPGQTDPISMLLWSAIYSATTQEDFENSVEFSISELRKALEIARGE